MSREIKFRAWDKNFKGIREVVMIHWTMKEVSFTDGFSKDLNDDIIIMQFTGLKDKNGKDIYEGDVVKVSYGTGNVIFHCGMFMIEWIDDKEALMESLAFAPNDFKFGRSREDVEVVGSIYEHSHLLNQNQIKQ